MIHHGKKSAALLLQKKSFFDENVKHIKKQMKISDLYVKQPIRKKCKNCNNILEEEDDFIKDGIGYKICKVCSHLNGKYEDTDSFCELVYGSDEKEYASNYLEEDRDSYIYRVNTIYQPKAEFLVTSLRSHDVAPNDLSYFDFGAGSGYFISALSQMGLKNISGSEVSASQVNLANYMLGDEILKVHELDDSEEVISQTKSQVVSLIGVLEHLQDPRSILLSISNNNAIEYLYISVPLFSLSVFIELISPDLFHRHLHGGHTHLYTEESLNHLCDEFNFDIISEWWFGSDVVDLYRSIYVTLEEKKVSQYTQELFKGMFMKILDPMQLEIDKKQLSSEVHLLLRKRK